MDRATFLLEKVIDELKSSPNSPWIDVLVRDSDEPYENQERRSVTRFCAFLTTDRVPIALQTSNWDLRIGDGLPGFVTGGGESPRYLRFGDENGVQPLIILREYPDARPSYYEICEEFRHFHNLFVNQNGSYIKFSDDGDEIEAIRVTPKLISIKRDLLTQFCAATRKYLALFLDASQFSKNSLEDFKLMDHCEDIVEGNFVMSRAIRPCLGLVLSKDKSLCTILAKIIIPPKAIEESGIWPFNEGNKHYVEFIIGYDEKGNERSFTCNSEKLSNYFGKNPGSPHFLTPVFFDREVLAKYYAKPSKYEVTDSYLRCHSFWGLRMDNNHTRYVIAFLGDLEMLPNKEQVHWRSYNVVPEGGISDVAFRRSFLAEFADPTRSDLRFKMIYERTLKEWKRKFGWDLYSEFHADDAHHMQTLRIPLNDEMAEFDGQVLSLAKILIDYLNEKAIVAALVAKKIPLESNAKGIAKLSALINALNLPSADQDIEHLKKLQKLRSRGSAHKKGSDYALTYDEVVGQGVTPQKGFDGLLSASVDMLNRWLEFLRD